MLIEYVSFLKYLFPNLTIYALIAISVYIPTAIIVGYFHRTKQLKTDIVLQAERNPYLREILERLERIERELVKNDIH